MRDAPAHIASGKVRVVGIYPESKINNKEAFAKFLQLK